ncbi:MAG: hypothetical protein ABIP35_00870, partial [Ginsengibacter sp.]
MKKILLSLFFMFSLFLFSFSQNLSHSTATKWVDSVFNSLSNDQRIAQLMVLRESSFSKNGAIYYDSLISDAIKKYNIGGILLFQGSPVKQAN